jgi:hypothetical protein
LRVIPAPIDDEPQAASADAPDNVRRELVKRVIKPPVEEGHGSRGDHPQTRVRYHAS